MSCQEMRPLHGRPSGWSRGFRAASIRTGSTAPTLERRSIVGVTPDDATVEGTSARSDPIAAIAAAVDPSRVLYGAVVSAGVLAVIGGHVDSVVQVLAGVIAVLAIYCLAHVYADLVGGPLGSAPQKPGHRAGIAFRRESAVVLGGLPGLVAVLVASLLGATVSLATTIALWVIVVLLAGAGYVGSRRSKRTGWRLVLDTAFAALFGVLAVLLKSLLH